MTWISLSRVLHGHPTSSKTLHRKSIHPSKDPPLLSFLVNTHKSKSDLTMHECKIKNLEIDISTIA